jgi:hypothetical protein
MYYWRAGLKTIHIFQFSSRPVYERLQSPVRATTAKPSLQGDRPSHAVIP